MRTDAISDLSCLTTIPKDSLSKLSEKLVYCIADAVAEAQKTGQPAVDIDIGIGTLSIGLVDDVAKYKLVPSDSLQSAVRYAIVDEQNLLERKLEQALVTKITSTYKDLL